MVRAIVLSPPDAASQEAVVGSAQRVVWHASGLHVTQPYSVVSTISALSIRILSLTRERSVGRDEKSPELCGTCAGVLFM